MEAIKSLPVLFRNPNILLIGGGKVALQKAKVLLDNEIDFSVVTQTLCNELNALNTKHKIKSFEKEDADNFNIIIDATGNKEVNLLLKEIKKKRFFLLNTVDVPEECDFYFSSLLRYKNLKVAVSSSGASPTVTQIVRDKIKEFLPDSLGDLIEQKSLERELGIVDIERTKEEAEKLFGKVYLIGCGIGDPELLTIKAYKTIQTVDVVFYDNLITEEILNLVPPHVEKIYVGKEKGNHTASQDAINKFLLDYAEQGYRVARLKNGDPYIFGRGAEEAEFLIRSNINVEVIAGISSAIAAPLSAGIPPTARGYSSGITIVTAHNDGCTFNSNWIELLKIPNHTVIVLMGLTQTEKIVDDALLKGVDKKLPAAIISNASRKNQTTIITTLENLADASRDADKPAVLVFGNVVNLSEILSAAAIKYSSAKEVAAG
ncbi:MAG: uroporphyrinogen-III C-methyltransferase [Ignavibacteriales bacterium]|nr:uroporphyrinogen-III C-methyltransferase [Ignavibacteriales bacterium]